MWRCTPGSRRSGGGGHWHLRWRHGGCGGLRRRRWWWYRRCHRITRQRWRCRHGKQRRRRDGRRTAGGVRRAHATAGRWAVDYVQHPPRAGRGAEVGQRQRRRRKEVASRAPKHAPRAAAPCELRLGGGGAATGDACRVQVCRRHEGERVLGLLLDEGVAASLAGCPALLDVEPQQSRDWGYTDTRSRL